MKIYLDSNVLTSSLFIVAMNIVMSTVLCTYICPDEDIWMEIKMFGIWTSKLKFLVCYVRAQQFYVAVRQSMIDCKVDIHKHWYYHCCNTKFMGIIKFLSIIGT